MSIGIMVSSTSVWMRKQSIWVEEEFGFKTEYVSAEVAQAIVEEEDARKICSRVLRLLR